MYQILMNTQHWAEDTSKNSSKKKKFIPLWSQMTRVHGQGGDGKTTMEQPKS